LTSTSSIYNFIFTFSFRGKSLILPYLSFITMYFLSTLPLLDGIFSDGYHFLQAVTCALAQYFDAIETLLF